MICIRKSLTLSSIISVLCFPDDNEDERKREQRKKDIETCFGFEEM